MFRSHFWGIMCLLLRFIPLFPLYDWRLLISSLCAELNLIKPRCMIRRMIFKALKIKEACKEGQKDPTE